MNKFGLRIAALVLVWCGWVPVAKAQTPEYLNTNLLAEERAADVVHRMTLEEKVSQLVNQARAIPRLNVPAYDFQNESLHGVMVDGTTEFPEPIGLAATFDAAAIHQMAIAIGTEGRIKHVQAVRAGDSGLFEGLNFWAPNINIFRDPRWGRGQEPTAKTPSSRAAWRSHLSPECRATIRSIIARSRRRSTSPCTAARSRNGTGSTLP